jgi:hypothetical protein
MSVKENLYLLLLIFKQEKLFGRAREGNLGSRRSFLSWRATKKLLAGRYLPTPGLDKAQKISDFELYTPLRSL